MLIGEHPVGSPPGVGDSYTEHTISYTIDQITTFTGVEPIEGGFRYSLNRVSGLYLLQHIISSYDMGYAASISNVRNTYTMSTGLLKALTSSDFDIIIRPSYESTIASTSVLNALVWSWAEVFDAIWRQMEIMSTALKLEHAQSTDLDDAWGQIYDLPRISSESDTSYRDRLKTRTIILNSSGTKSNCETIIDSIIESESTEITSRYPATVDIRFLTVDAMRVAKDKLTTLQVLIPQMLAHGIQYNMFLPFGDYSMDTVMNGPVYLPYNTFLAIKQRNTDITYSMAYSQNIQSLITYTTDIVTLKTKISSLLVGSMITLSKIISKIFDMRLQKSPIKDISYNIAINKNMIPFSIETDMYIEKYNINKTILFDQLIRDSKRRNYNLDMRSIYKNILTYSMDIVLMLFRSTFDMDILTRRDFPKKYGMILTLVGA